MRFSHRTFVIPLNILCIFASAAPQCNVIDLSSSLTVVSQSGTDTTVSSIQTILLSRDNFHNYFFNAVTDVVIAIVTSGSSKVVRHQKPYKFDVPAVSE